MNALVLQGRRIAPEDTALIKGLVAVNPGWSRRRLSLELCRQWNWRNGQGRWLAGLLFGSSAWQCRERDGWIGWNQEQREKNLNLTTNKEAKAFIAELTRQLFGQKAGQLSPAQEEQLKEVAGDTQEQAERPPPISRQCLEAELEGKPPQKERRARQRHPFPTDLERVTVIWEPVLPPCPPGGVCKKIGEAVTEELDFLPAKLISRRIVRPKYAASWDQGGVRIAPLPPRLFPQSRLGLGLAVFITLSRFDDHLSYYKLEQNFQERYGVAIWFIARMRQLYRTEKESREMTPEERQQ